MLLWSWIVGSIATCTIAILVGFTLLNLADTEHLSAPYVAKQLVELFLPHFTKLNFKFLDLVWFGLYVINSNGDSSCFLRANSNISFDSNCEFAIGMVWAFHFWHKTCLSRAGRFNRRYSPPPDGPISTGTTGTVVFGRSIAWRSNGEDIHLFRSRG